MPTVIVVEHDHLIGPDLRWALRIAKMRNAAIDFIVIADKQDGEERKRIDISDPSGSAAYERMICGRIRETLDTQIGAESWTDIAPASRDKENEDDIDAEDTALLVQARLTTLRFLVDDVKRLVEEPGSDTVLFVCSSDPKRLDSWMGLLQSLLRSVACSMAVIVPANRVENAFLKVL